jgi:hypothetical protein
MEKLSFEYWRSSTWTNAAIGLIDTIQLYLNKEQLLAAKTTIFSKSKNVQSQTNVLQEQLKTTLIEQKEFRICLLKTQPQNDKLTKWKAK